MGWVLLKGTNQEFGRPYNRRIVLKTIRLNAPIARGDIAKRVGLTVQTVSTITRELELQGFINSLREAPKSRGYPPAALTINPEGGFAIGVHITPKSVEAALINGARKTIYWYAGQPLPVSGGGGLDLGPAHVDADAHGVTWSITGTSAFKPGRYRFGSSVAASAQSGGPDPSANS